MTTFMAAGAGLTSLGEVITFLTGLFTSTLATIVAEPLLLLTVGIFATGSVIGLVHRLIRG